MYEDFIKATDETDDIGEEHFLPDQFVADYPNLSLALSGKCGSKAAKTKAIPPASISLRCGDLGVKFTITPRGAKQVLQGFVAEPGSLLSQIEEKLSEGHYSTARAFGK